MPKGAPQPTSALPWLRPAALGTATVGLLLALTGFVMNLMASNVDPDSGNLLRQIQLASAFAGAAVPFTLFGGLVYLAERPRAGNA